MTFEQQLEQLENKLIKEKQFRSMFKWTGNADEIKRLEFGIHQLKMMLGIAEVHQDDF